MYRNTKEKESKVSIYMYFNVWLTPPLKKLVFIFGKREQEGTYEHLYILEGLKCVYIYIHLVYFISHHICQYVFILIDESYIYKCHLFKAQEIYVMYY